MTGTRPPPRSSHPLATYADVVTDYIARVRPGACERLAFYANQMCLDHALDVVSSWRGADGECEPHQRWLAKAAKEEAAARIRRLEVGRVESFEELFQAVQAALGSIDGIGALTIYDVSLRLGALLGFPPARVHLQRGSLEGARHLGLDGRRGSLPTEAFPAEFRRLHAWEIENCLCLYKRELRRIAAPARARAA